MKKQLLLLALLIFSISFFTSAQITFQKRLGITAVNYGSYGNSIQQTYDGGYIIKCSLDNLTGTSSEAALIKTNASGDTTWTRTYTGLYDIDASNGNGNFYSSTVYQTADSGYIFTGTTRGTVGFDAIYLVKTNKTGNIQWQKMYGNGFVTSTKEFGLSVQQTFDGGYIIGGITQSVAVGTLKALLIKTDANGDTLWTKTYDGIAGSATWAYQVEQTADSGYIFTGATVNSGATQRDAYLVKTNVNGDTLWTKAYGSPVNNEYGYSVQQTSDGGYVVGGISQNAASVGNFYLIKTNSVGDTLWTRTYGGTASDEQGFFVRQTNDDGYIMTGLINSISLPTSAVFLVKTTASGDTLWTRTYGGTNAYSTCVRQTVDDGFIIIGSMSPVGYDIFIIKTDANGNAGCNQLYLPIDVGTIPAQIHGTDFHALPDVGSVTTQTAYTERSGGRVKATLCFSVGINEIEADNSLLVYPNPFNNEFTIQGTNEKGIVTIFDITGKNIFSQRTYKREIQINAENLLPGFYFLHYIEENKTVNIKLVKF